MKIKIDDTGGLYINGKAKYCPYTEDQFQCGDWCALFVGQVLNPINKLTAIDLCSKTLFCSGADFTDERIPDEETTP